MISASALDAKPEGIELEKILEDKWYHSLELAPGKFTKGKDFLNVAVTRHLLQSCEIENQRCLDIGAMDFLITLVLLRRKAKAVWAYDRLANRRQKERYVKRLLGVDFKYVSGIKLSQLPAACHQAGMPVFDVTVFSGVLYHMFDPLAGLCLVRSLTRRGGLCVIETSAVTDNSRAMYFNEKGKYYQRSTYWQVSLKCLDYLLRFARLAPIDFCVLHDMGRTVNHLRRVGIVCRAVDTCLPDQDDLWMQDTRFFRDDFGEVPEAGREEDRNLPDVKYEIQNKRLVMRRNNTTVDLYGTFKKSKPLKIENFDRQVRLTLDAKG